MPQQTNKKIINKQVNGRWRASLTEVIRFIDIIPFNNTMLI